MLDSLNTASPSTLMHPIEAMNHRKAGFFPTDADTVERVLSLLIPSDEPMNLLDPCCGEGEALERFKRDFPNAHTLGVELDAKRCKQAKDWLDSAYNADVYDVSFGRSHFDLLFLNPPYGNDMADKFSNDKTERLEHKFLSLTFPALKAEGVLVYIVPEKSIDEPRVKWLLARFKDLTIHKAAVDTYKQVVVMGTKLKQQRAVNSQMVKDFTTQFANRGLMPKQSISYSVPSSRTVAKIRVNRLNAVGVSEVASNYKAQWSYFNTLFREGNASTFRQPLHPLSDWHLALLITSGAVQGIVENGERKLLVKGATKKHKDTTHTQTVDEKTNTVTTVFEAKDRFRAQIKAIDIDENSPMFGEVITIR